MNLALDAPSEKQVLFLRASTKHVGFGGARGGGKSHAVRTKAVLMALNYPGIRQLIVRRTYPELVNNHINQLRVLLLNVARYNDKDKVFKFRNGSTINFMYCAKDSDLDRLQGVEYDVIYLDEATQLSEHQMKVIGACVRGANDFPKRVYYTMNPGGQGHSYIKRIFIDRKYEEGEDPEEYSFIQSLVTDNKALMAKDPDYVKQLEALPPKLRDAWLYGRWDIFEGQFFEEFRDTPDPAKALEEGCTVEELLHQRRWTHVIEPFEPPKGWTICRSYDFGFNKPFSCGWWAVDYDGVLYRIMELYGCTRTPNEGWKWTPDLQFAEIARIEREHPWLAGRKITGVADPSIWDASRGVSTAEEAARKGVLFTPGDNERIPGWMQCHYRLRFDESGYPMMYVFSNCAGFRRTIPGLMYDEHRPEDLDTDGEDHIADEWRYMCMSRPIKPVQRREAEVVVTGNPLNQMGRLRRQGHIITTQIRVED